MDIAQFSVTAGGLASIAALVWYFFGPDKSARAAVGDGVQEVRITGKGGYSPDLIRVQQGVFLRLVFGRQENSDCFSRVVLPDFGVSRALKPFGTTTVDLVPEKPGEYGFACGMNMLHGNPDRQGGGAGERCRC